MSVVGYDLRMPQDPALCYQNSWGEGDPVYCLSRSEFEEDSSWGRCTVAHYPESVQYPLLMDYGTPAFNTWWQTAAEDKNVDGIPDSVAKDADGDGAFDIYDHDPRNPYLRIDTDNDTYGEPRLDGVSVLNTVENCLAWCTSLEQLSGYSGDNEGGGQGCRDRCNNFDRCITGSIKNIWDNQCDWSCLSTRGRDRNGNHIIEPNEICSPHPSHPEWDHCCFSDELQLLDNVCGPLYHNVSNEDSDEFNPGVDDPSRIADVCEEARVTRPVFSLDTIVYVEEDMAVPVIRVDWECRESIAKIEFGLFGGSQWMWQGSRRSEIVSVTQNHRIFEVGVCGCDGDWTLDCLGGGFCREDDEELPWPDNGYQVWRDIEALECAEFTGWPYSPNPSHSPLCDDKVSAHTRDEDCSDLECAVQELRWRWNDDLNVHPGETVKVRVGLRRLGESWDQNELYTSPSAITLPQEPISCRPSERLLQGWQYLEPHEAPGLPLGEHRGAYSLGWDSASRELYLFAFDKGQRGPMNPRRLGYATATTPRITDSGFVAVTGRERSELFGFAGQGTEALFVVGRRPVGPVVDPGDGSDAQPGAPEVFSLWVAGLGEGLDKLSLAEEVFGPSAAHPPMMSAPRAVWDRSLGRLLVAGGGESGQFGLWAYTPDLGQWAEIPTGLPGNLTGFSLVADKARHRLYLLAGQGAAGASPRLVTIELYTGQTADMPPPPPALARQGQAMAIDPFNRFLYVFGGRQGQQVMGDLWQYDLRQQAWTQLADGSDPSGPGAREGAQLLYERRYGRLWLSGGRDDDGHKGATPWGFATALNEWSERPLGPARSPAGDALSGLFSPDTPVMWVMEVDETVSYPGQLTRIGLISDDPCVGLMVWDSTGERITRSRHCATGERVVSFMAQPGERYQMELVTLPGFDPHLASPFEVTVEQAELVAAGVHVVGPAWVRPRALAVGPGVQGQVAYVLKPLSLWSVDLSVVDEPQTLDALLVPGGLAVDLALRGSTQAVVSLLGPRRSPDLRLVDLTDPQRLALSGSVRLPGLAGRLVAVWRGGRVYAARAGKLEVVDLTSPAGPKRVGSIRVGGGLVTCLAVHGDRLYVCTAPGKLKVYELSRTSSAQQSHEVDLDQIGHVVRVHGETVHVGELPLWRYLLCLAGGACDQGGRVEVFRYEAGGALLKAGEYPVDERSLPHLELAGSGAVRLEQGGFRSYRVEVVP